MPYTRLRPYIRLRLHTPTTVHAFDFTRLRLHTLLPTYAYVRLHVYDYMHNDYTRLCLNMPATLHAYAYVRFCLSMPTTTRAYASTRLSRYTPTTIHTYD